MHNAVSRRAVQFYNTLLSQVGRTVKQIGFGATAAWITLF
jgi:hypothetical protein